MGPMASIHRGDGCVRLWGTRQAAGRRGGPRARSSPPRRNVAPSPGTQGPPPTRNPPPRGCASGSRGEAAAHAAAVPPARPATRGALPVPCLTDFPPWDYPQRTVVVPCLLCVARWQAHRRRELHRTQTPENIKPWLPPLCHRGAWPSPAQPLCHARTRPPVPATTPSTPRPLLVRPPPIVPPPAPPPPCPHPRASAREAPSPHPPPREDPPPQVHHPPPRYRRQARSRR